MHRADSSGGCAIGVYGLGSDDRERGGGRAPEPFLCSRSCALLSPRVGAAYCQCWTTRATVEPSGRGGRRNFHPKGRVLASIPTPPRRPVDRACPPLLVSVKRAEIE